MAFFAPLFAPIVEIVGKVLDKIVPDANQRAQAKEDFVKQLLQTDLQETMAQIQTNIEEAKHDGIFVAGWRPFVGWVCGSALAYNYVLQPFLAFAVGVFRFQLPPLPLLDNAGMMTVLLGMLGLGGMRTFEKYSGVANVPTGR